MRRAFPAGLVLLAACAGGVEPLPQERAPWQYRPNLGYINPSTNEQRTPQQLYDAAAALQESGRQVEAAAIYRVLADTAPDPALRASALYARGVCAGQAGAFADAYRDFETYQSRYPDADLATRAKLMMMECALGLARAGVMESVLGIPMYTSSRAGVELLKSTLQRFPREEFSDDYYYRLAAFHHERGEADEAELELRFILGDAAYQRSNSAPRALLLLGQLGLERYDGVWYDHKMIADAKRAYERFISDYQQFADDPDKAREFGIEDFPRMIELARQGIARCNEALAEREIAVAEYYLGQGSPEAAKIYLGTVLKTYAGTRAAARAAKRLQELE